MLAALVGSFGFLTRWLAIWQLYQDKAALRSGKVVGIGENSCPAGVGRKLIFYVSNDSSVFLSGLSWLCASDRAPGLSGALLCCMAFS